MGAGDHRCEWRDEAERLRADVAYAAEALETAETKIAQLEEQLRQKNEALALGLIRFRGQFDYAACFS